MKILLRSNDPVLVSFVCSVLADNDVHAVVLDSHMSVAEGSLGALPRRVMVLDEDFDSARTALRAAGVGGELEDS